MRCFDWFDLQLILIPEDRDPRQRKPVGPVETYEYIRISFGDPGNEVFSITVSTEINDLARGYRAESIDETRNGYIISPTISRGISDRLLAAQRNNRALFLKDVKSAQQNTERLVTDSSSSSKMVAQFQLKNRTAEWNEKRRRRNNELRTQLQCNTDEVFVRPPILVLDRSVEVHHPYRPYHHRLHHPNRPA